MFIKIAILVFAVMILFFCTGQIFPDLGNLKRPIISDGQIDIDRNGSFDVIIEKNFITTIDTLIKSFEINPLNDSKILHRRRSGVEIFQVGDTIRSEADFGHYWLPSESILALKAPPDTTRWRGLWAGKTGYCALKIKIQAAHHCAWIYMKIDTLDEDFKVFNASYNPVSNQDFIIIN